MSLDRLYSVEKAARALGGISRWTVYLWFRTGKIQRTRVGRRVMISESELSRFIQAQNRGVSGDTELHGGAQSRNQGGSSHTVGCQAESGRLSAQDGLSIVEDQDGRR
jgi:excisionase family DNA binding protein